MKLGDGKQTVTGTQARHEGAAEGGGRATGRGNRA